MGRWKARLACYAGGFAFSAACFVLLFEWMSVVTWWMPEVRNFDAQPEALKLARNVVGYLPWVAAAVVLVLRVGRGPRIAVLSCLAGLATPYLAIMAFLLGSPVIEAWWHEQPFDAVAWRNQDEKIDSISPGMWPARLCMVDDLIESGRLDGLTREAVVSLLGEPLPRGSFPAGAMHTDMHYYLGPERGLFRIDSEWLFIDLDAKGVVEHYSIYRD
jgi:hypothetical protein